MTPAIGPDHVSAWHLVLSDDDFNLACNAVKLVARTKPVSDKGNFGPTVQEVTDAMRKLAAPYLTLSYEEAKDQNHPIYKQAHRQIYGKQQVYNPNADPSTLLKTSDIPFKERECRRAYEHLMEKAAMMTIPELLELTKKVELRIENANQNKLKKLERK